MEEQKQGGLESVVSKDEPMQKKHKRLIAILGQLPTFMITAVAGVGLAVSLYFGGLTAYKTVDEFVSVEDGAVEAAEASEGPSPYNGCIIYCLIFGMCALSGTSFGYATIASVKEAKDAIEEEMKKQ
ncbi:MAG: hypothetical protein PHO02_00495 [Candidatus Nanoarchaeia archaeon]|nr:hypothetical protein [Candidatus Nanoarchaeia archaeon]